ncbi:MAG TPA: BON domain-containing protein [Pyrinomonadaceae bacterium]|nr:BON domain-containing protein [Pyrinomonadaceae bacterium]
MKKFAALVASLALAALAAGCSGDNGNNGNMNMSNANAHNTNVTVNANANANANTSNANRYHSGMTRQEYEANKSTYEQEAKQKGSKIGQGADDMWLWVKTRSALLAASDLTSTGIDVDVEDGVITLRGTVPAQDQVKKADDVAKGIEGKKRVVNMLKVAPAGGSSNTNSNARANNSNRH